MLESSQNIAKKSCSVKKNTFANSVFDMTVKSSCVRSKVYISDKLRGERKWREIY